MTKRTDPHRPGAIVPGEYVHVLSYNGATTEDGWPVPSFGINCELDRRTHERDAEGKVTKTINGKHDPDGRCCIIGLLHVAKVKWAPTGSTGQCTACGSHFVYGEVWRHEPTGEHIHLGNVCGAKYGLMVDRSAFEMAAGRAKAAAAKEIQRERNAEERAEFLAKHPGLEEALAEDHGILRDIASRFKAYRSLSDKQVALALKIADEVRNPPPAEKHVPAPIESGRQAVRGRVVSLKSYEGQFGTSLKMTVKIETPAGTWLAWGTCPSSICPAVRGGCDRGDVVEFTAKLKPGRDEHFALFSRPTKAWVVEKADKED